MCRTGLLPFVFAMTVLAQADLRATLDKYCVGCHNTRNKSGSLALDAVPADSAMTWERVVRRLRARSMPPAGMPRPTSATYEAVIASLENTLDGGKLNPGRTDTFRRLNRTEYRNAVRDLLALDVDVSALLPPDDSSHGFDNVTVGDLSPTLLERYLSAARKISRLAIGIPGKAPGGETVILPPDLTQETHFESLPLGTRGGLVMPYTFPVDGEYEFQIRLARDRNEHVEGLNAEHDVELLIDGERIRLFAVKPPGGGKDHSNADTHLNVRVEVKAGPHVVMATFPKKYSAMLETERQPYEAHFNMDRHPRITPAVYSVTVNGPFTVKGPGDSPSRRRLLVCKPASLNEEEPCAKKIFQNVARRAYRRSVTDADVAAPLRFFREARAGASFETGIEMGLRSILVSPDFVFRVEQDPAGAASGTAYRVSPFELASRLSFFLWSSIPDDELLAAAEKNTLQNPAVVEKQVRRMLADERSRALVNNFAEQWLYLRNLSSSNPDMRLFAGFDDNLRQAFRRETELFFESIMREDRSVLDLLRANYTFLNERLAKHYEIPNIYGSRFRRVELTPEMHRGGLLRHGSVLTVTSYAHRTTPVIRGKWILDNLLSVPPPPPPPQVPALKENAGIGKNLTMRERMAQHRVNPQCASCHNVIDPVGFAMENYDAVGRWRTTEEGKPIDNAGSLPDGAKFNGVDGLQAAILRYPDLFATTVAEKLLTYGLGRGVEYFDGPAVRKVVRSAKAQDYKFSSFIIGVTGSAPFQMRRSQ
jgi:hypothetical protein